MRRGMDAFDKFRLMLDEYSSQIIELTSERPLNAVELGDALGIPIAACYRRIRALKQAGIIKEEGRAMSCGGKLVATYRSSVDNAQVMLQDGRLRVEISTDGEDLSSEVELADQPTMLHWVMQRQKPGQE